MDIRLLEKYLKISFRLLLGLAFTVFGVNGILGFFGMSFIPMEPPPAGSMAMTFFAGLGAIKIMYAVKIVELTAGLLLLSGIFVPFALTLLAPILITVFMFHIFLDPGDLAMIVFLLILEIPLAWFYRSSFKHLFIKG